MSCAPLLLRLLFGAVLLLAHAAAADDLPYIARIAIERVPGDATTFTDTVLSKLHVNNPEKSAALLSHINGLDVVATDEDTVSVEYVEKPTLAGDVDEKFLQSTWVIDFDEDAVQALMGALDAGFEVTPSADDLQRYVFEYIADKSYSRAFDLASRVASTGEGDCTEHAVLLAALARANGYYARVTFGNLILDTDAGLFAFGHAWTEIHDGENWQIMDATMPDNDLSLRQLRYLPFAILGDEGPGYSLSLIEVMSSMPLRITGVENLD